MAIMALTVKNLNDAIDGLVTITTRGVEDPLKMGEKDKKLYQQFVGQGWGIDSGRNVGNCRPYYAYDMHCYITEAPVIRMFFKVKYAGVSLDMITTGHRLNDKGFELLCDAYKKSGAREIEAGDLYFQSHRVPRDNAKSLASELVAIARDKSNWGTL